MKTNTLKIDFANGRLIMDRTFAKSAAYVGSNEYNVLQNARRDYPSFILETRTIKRNPHKESYRGLTYEYMKKYIASHNKELLKVFEEMILQSKCHSIRYPHIKAWFLATFPEVESFGKKKNEETKVIEISQVETAENAEPKVENELSIVKGVPALDTQIAA